MPTQQQLRLDPRRILVRWRQPLQCAASEKQAVRPAH